MFFYICFPQKGTLTLTPGMGMGGGPFRTPNPPNSQTNHKTSLTIATQFKKSLRTRFFIFFHWKGTLTLTPGTGRRGGGGNPKTSLSTNNKHINQREIFFKHIVLNIFIYFIYLINYILYIFIY